MSNELISEEEFTERCLHRMSQLSKIFAKNKGDLERLQQQRKALKAILMQEAEKRNITSLQKQERDAYADERFWAIAEAIGVAQQKSTEAYYQLKIFEIKFEKWRTGRADFRAAAIR
jgi:uncharacterized protein YPO0396